MRRWALGLVALLLGCKEEPAARTDPPPPPSTSSAPARPTLPADPPPSHPELAGEVPDLEAKLAANKTYAAMWEPAKQDDRRLILTGFSQLLIAGGLSGPAREALNAKPEAKDATIKLFLFFSRMGRPPEPFSAALRGHLDAVKNERHLGVWSAHEPGKVPHDYAALAAWLMRDRADYFREVIAAKSLGPQGWSTAEKPLIPYVASHRATLERLALLTELTPDEQARLAELRQPKPREGSVTMASYQKLKTGMSYDEVVAIFGEKGEELSSSELAGISTIMYKWDGPDLGANVNVMFQNGRLVTKAQFGLR